jgi:hypothetical protein
LKEFSILSAQHSTQWFWSDWLGDQAVRRLTLAERGLWIDLLHFAAVGSPTGYVCDDRGTPLTHEEIARVTNAGSPVEVAKLIEAIVEKGVASRDRTGRLFNRRMVRQAELSAKRKRAGKLGGDHTKLKWQSFQPLPQHLSGQMLGQVPQHRVSAPSKSRTKTSSEAASARASPAQNGKAVQKTDETDRSLATAPGDGALTRDPLTEQTAQGLSGKKPSEVTRAELEAMMAKKKTAAA